MRSASSRALEVYRETGKTISAHNAETKGPAAPVRRRVDRPPVPGPGGHEDPDRPPGGRHGGGGPAGGGGAAAESGLPREATALQAIGYKEFLGVLDGTATVEEAVAEVKLRSRQYAKRQLTWLRRNPDIHWIWWEKDRDFARALQVSTEILARRCVF